MLKLDKIIKTYNKGKNNAFEALHGISLTVESGEMVAIVGTSGAGNLPYYIFLPVLMATIRENTILMIW